MTIRMDGQRGQVGVAAAVLVAVLVVMAIPASARQGQVHQCVDGRNVSYQATPCTQGRSVKQWSLPASAPSATIAVPAIHQGAAHPLVRTRKLRAASVPRVATRPPVAQRGRPSDGRRGVATDDSCESTRAQRAAAYEKVGLKRGFALSSHWDNKVQQACR